MKSLASLKLTAPAMAALALGALVSYNSEDAHAVWLVAPLAILTLNLMAAVLFNPRFRRQGGLMVFHIGLLLVLLLAAWGRMARLDGRLEIAEGQVFDPAQVTVDRRGPWHPWGLDRVAFEQGGVEVDYIPGLKRDHTRSQVRIPGRDAHWETLTVGDDTPLLAGAYRFYTTSNKGFAVIATWLGEGGKVETGAVHLPSYPMLDWKQVNDWITPAGEQVKIDLRLPVPREEDLAWTLSSAVSEGARLSVRSERGEVELAPGQTVELLNGRVRFEEVRMWMGYRITYDPTLPWLLAAALIAVLGLAWHFWCRLWSRPLIPGDSSAGARSERKLEGAAIVRT